MSAKQLNLATGKQANNPSLANWNPTFEEFCGKVSQTVVGAKDGAYFIRCAGTKRTNADTSDVASILILDGDSSVDPTIKGAPDPKLVSQTLGDMGFNHCIYTSHSNKPGVHKYRVILPCSYGRDELADLLHYLFGLLHEEGVMLMPVAENRAWSQAWYFPRVPEEHKALFLFHNHTDGVDFALPAGYVKEADAKPEPTPKPSASLANTKVVDTKGAISPIAAFNAHYSPFAYLLGQCYTLHGSRLRHPSSSSGIPAVQLCSHGNRVYSHGNDLLNDGYAHDAFDCFRLLECGGDEKEALLQVGRTFYIGERTIEEHNRECFSRTKGAV